ncbi:MAG: sialidase family protein [Caldilineaceae bacterium]
MRNIRHTTLFRDRHRYAMGPSIAITPNGDWLVAFNLTVMREIGPHSPRAWLHPPYDPDYRNFLIRSTDQGQTWKAPQPIPSYDWLGTECPGLAVLANGKMLLTVYRRKFYPPVEMVKLAAQPGAVLRQPLPWISCHEGTYVHRSQDNGQSWVATTKINTQPYISGYSHRGAVELADSTLLQPLAAADPFYDIYFLETKVWEGEPLGNEWNADGTVKVGKSAAFVAISEDGGDTWNQTREIARDPAVNFYEPVLARLANGRLLCHLRSSEEGGEYLYQVTSDDQGLTWSKPWRTPIWGYPADIVQLPDGRVLSVYGYRRPPFGIRACLSHDNGDSWEIADELIIRDNLPNRNLGYPEAIVLEDGSLFVVYWGEEPDGVTTIQGTHFEL